MALIKCKECGHEISKKAKECPNCGAPRRRPPKQYSLGKLIIVILLGWFIYAVFTADYSGTSKSPTSGAASGTEATLKGDYMACVSEELFDQIISAIRQNDRRAVDYLLEHGCIITKAGFPVSLIDSTWTGKARVRAYTGDDSIILWAPIEAIQH